MVQFHRPTRLDRVAAAFPNRQLHVILDNLSTHKKNEEWLKAHPNVKFRAGPGNLNKTMSGVSA